MKRTHAVTSIYVSEDLKDRLAVAAKAEERSVSSLVRIAIVEYLNKTK